MDHSPARTLSQSVPQASPLIWSMGFAATNWTFLRSYWEGSGSQCDSILRVRLGVFKPSSRMATLISIEPTVEEEEEEEEVLEEILVAGISNLVLLTPATVNEMAADHGHLNLQDRPVTFEELEDDQAAYGDFAGGFINLDHCSDNTLRYH
ncbi:hypothetical protein BGX30_006833 [Mortierella sp. GBA39]|nr:hypothetical protein BGX30_006833 [Mortierella sp. GBA39]